LGRASKEWNNYHTKNADVSRSELLSSVRPAVTLGVFSDSLSLIYAPILALCQRVAAPNLKPLPTLQLFLKWALAKAQEEASAIARK